MALTLQEILAGLADKTASDLTAIGNAVDERRVQLRDIEGPALLARFENELRSLGYKDAKDLLARKSGKRGRGRPAKENNGHAERG